MKKTIVLKLTYQEKYLLVGSIAAKLRQLRSLKQLFKINNEKIRLDHHKVLNTDIEFHALAETLLHELKALLDYKGDIVTNLDLEKLLIDGNVYRMVAAEIYDDVQSKISAQPPIGDRQFKHHVRITEPRVRAFVTSLRMNGHGQPHPVH